jgi:hypothetical protein
VSTVFLAVSRASHGPNRVPRFAVTRTEYTLKKGET